MDENQNLSGYSVGKFNLWEMVNVPLVCGLIWHQNTMTISGVKVSVTLLDKLIRVILSYAWEQGFQCNILRVSINLNSSEMVLW